MHNPGPEAENCYAYKKKLYIMKLSVENFSGIVSDELMRQTYEHRKKLKQNYWVAGES